MTSIVMFEEWLILYLLLCFDADGWVTGMLSSTKTCASCPHRGSVPDIWRSRTKGEPVYLGLPGTWPLKWRYDITPVGLRYSSAFGLGFNDSCNTDYVNFISIAGFWLHVGSGVFWCCILCTALGCLHLTWHLRQSWRSRLGSWRSHRWLVLIWSLPNWQMLCAPVLKRYHSESVCEQSYAESTGCTLFCMWTITVFSLGL